MKPSAKAHNIKKLYTSTAFLAVIAVTSSAYAEGVAEGQFSKGDGTFAHTANQTTITLHTADSVLNFTNLNIASGQTLLYNNDIGGTVNNLSRVQNAASIFGNLITKDVNLFLVAPNGVVFGKDAQVNVPNLVVSTSDISDANFMARDYKFNIKSHNPNAAIINRGNITIADAGLAAFVAPNVINEGLIVANQGKVTLAAGDEFTLDLYGDKLVNFVVSEDEKNRLVKQSGEIAAKNGKVVLTIQDATKVVNNTINMDGVTEAKDIQVSGDKIILGGANKVLIADKGSAKIIAKDTLVTDGQIKGKDAFLETSAPNITLAHTLDVDTGDGLWLIDPTNFTVSTAATAANNWNNADLAKQLNTNNITIATSGSGAGDGDITISANVEKTSGSSKTLTLNAHDDITLNSGVTLSSKSNGLSVAFQAAGDVNINGTVNTNGGDFTVTDKAGKANASLFQVANTGSVNANGGDIKIWANTITNDGPISTKSTGTVDLKGNNITLNRQITSGDAGSSNHGTSIDISTGVLKINAPMVTDGEFAITASKGAYVELADVITADDGISATGVSRVDVTKTSGIINQAINIVNSAGTVNVKAGKYNQSVRIDKNITLNGDGMGITVIAPTTNPAVEDDHGTSIRPIIFVDDANATIKNLTVDGAGVGTGLGKGQTIAGIFLDDSTSTVDSVFVRNISDTSGKSNGIVALNADNSIIKNTSFHNNNTDILITDGTTKFVINNSTFNGSKTGVRVDDSKSNFSFTGTDNLFANQQTYIDLKNGAMNNSVTDATAVRFENKTGADMTNDELIAAEGKINHEMDDTGLGFVKLKNGTVVTTTGSGIQFAVDKSSSGDTVLVSDGIYDEGVIIGKNLTLAGDSNGGAIVRPTSQNDIRETFISSYDANEINAPIILAKNANVNISNLEVDGSKLQTGYNKNERAVGIGYDNAGGVIDNVYVHGNSDDQLHRGIGIFVDVDSTKHSSVNTRAEEYDDEHDDEREEYEGKAFTLLIAPPSGDSAKNITITNSDITDYQQKGINTNGNLLTATIGSNNVDGKNKGNQQGIEVSRGALGIVEGNTVKNNNLLPGFVFANKAVDILIYKAADGTIVRNNDLTQGGVSLDNIGISIDGSNKAQVTGNSVANRRVGINVVGSNDVQVINNDAHNGGLGLSVSNSKGVQVINQGKGANTFHDNSSSGIWILKSDNAHIEGAQTYNNYHGILIESSNNAELYSNNAYGNQFYGVVASASDNLTIGAGNNIHDNNHNGVALFNSKDATITGSTINDNNDSGIFAQNSDNLKIIDSTISGNKVTGVDLLDANNVRISGTTISGSQTGVELNGKSKGLVLADTSIKGGATGLQVNGVDANVSFEGSGNSFSGQSGQYIDLENNTMFGQILDASQVTFDGVVAGDANDAESFALEHKLHHKVDDFNVGLIMWKPETVFTDGSIQAAVNAADAGWTVKVNEGIYDESVIINKDLTVKKGDVEGAAIVAPSEYSVLNNRFTSSYNYNEINVPIILAQNATVNISGLTIDGTNVQEGYAGNERALGIGYDNAGGVIENVYVHDSFDDGLNRGLGIFADSNSTINIPSKLASFVGDDFQDTKVIEIGSIDVESDDSARTITISGSNVTNYQQKGINANGDLLTAQVGGNVEETEEEFKVAKFASIISGNFVDGNNNKIKQQGIEISRGATGYVVANTVLNNTADGSSDILFTSANSDSYSENNDLTQGESSTGNIGIQILNSDEISSSGDSITSRGKGILIDNSKNVTISGDTLNDNVTGALITNGGSADISGTKINGGTNGLVVTGAPSSVSFSGTENSFSGQSDQYISLEDGAMFGDVLDVSDVTFDGVVAGSSTDDESFAIEDKIHHKMDDNNVGLVMWRADNLFATLNNRGIQAGIDIANDGWTVNIDEGTFYENLFLDKDVNLIGRGSASTIVDGGSDIALTINSNADFLVKGINFTTNSNENNEEETQKSGGIAQFAVVVDGSRSQEGEEELITINGPLNVDFDDILFTGTQDQAALDFRNATTVGGVSVNNVVFSSTAANGWLFENVEGGAPSDVFGEDDLNFGNTFFGGNYEVADIHLINTVMDGNAENATFFGDGGSPFAREDRVIHDYDIPELGTIFYNGIAEVYAARDGSGLGAFARFLSEKTDINNPYFHPDSNIGRVFDGPSLISPEGSQFNATNDPRVNLNGGNGGGNTPPTPGQLENLNTASGEDLNDLQPASGGEQGNNNQEDCGTNFGNNFLGDNVSLANSNGSCSTNNL